MQGKGIRCVLYGSRLCVTGCRRQSVTQKSRDSVCIFDHNGFYATPHNVEAVMKAGLDSLKFSLNNSDPNQFRQVTGMAAS